MKKISPLIYVLAIAVIGILGYMAYGMNVSSEGDSTNPTQCGDSTGVLTVSTKSLLVGGTAPSSPAVTCGINGGPVTTSVTSGTTTFPVGSDLECLVSDTDSIDRSFEFTMPCGGYTIDDGLYYSTSDNPSIIIKDDDGDTLTNAIDGAGTDGNISSPTAGGTVKFAVEFTGTSGEGSGEGIYVIEFTAGSSANITDVTMGGLSQVPVPTVHTSQNAGSKVVAFAVPNIEGAVEREYAVIVTLGSGKDFASGGIYTDAYWGQEFIDDDDTIASGVEDSDGTAKYENTADYDIYVE